VHRSETVLMQKFEGILAGGVTDFGEHTGVSTGATGVAEPGPEGGVGGDPTVEPTKKMFRRFHGSIKLDPIKASLDFSTITQEVIQHFSSILGTKVNISLEIEALSNKGFDDSIRRTVQENSRTLGFNHAEFEED
jgi:hypothetical protein